MLWSETPRVKARDTSESRILYLQCISIHIIYPARNSPYIRKLMKPVCTRPPFLRVSRGTAVLVHPRSKDHLFSEKRICHSMRLLALPCPSSDDSRHSNARKSHDSIDLSLSSIRLLNRPLQHLQLRLHQSQTAALLPICILIRPHFSIALEIHQRPD